MKVEVTDLKAPNDANETVDNATGVQVKLWIGSDSNDPDDTGAPDVLKTDATITGGVLSVPLDTGGTPTVDDTNKIVNGSNSTAASVSFAHPGGLSIVFASRGATDDSNISTATFDGVAMTAVGTCVLQTDVQGCLYKIEGVAKTANISVLTEDSAALPFFAVPVGENVAIRDSTIFGTTASEVSGTVDSAVGDLVLQFVRWRNSAENVSSYSTDQTQVLTDNSPTRMDSSKKTGAATSTTMTTTLTTASGNNVVSAVVSVSPSGIGSVGDPVLGVAKWSDSNETWFFPIDTIVTEDSSGP